MLLHVYNGSDWKSTLLEVVPQRKGAIALPAHSATAISIPASKQQQEEENNCPARTIPDCDPPLVTNISEAIPNSDPDDQKN